MDGFEQNMKELAESQERTRIEKETKENKRFWLNFWLAITAILISLGSVVLQYTQGSRIQEVRILKDTTQQNEPLYLNQSDRQKKSEAHFFGYFKSYSNNQSKITPSFALRKIEAALAVFFFTRISLCAI